MKKVKKIWAALLSLAMILAIVPQTMAAGEEAVEYVYAEASTASSVVGYTQDANGMIIWGGEEATVPTLTYEFNLANSGEYDVWVDSFDGWGDVTWSQIDGGEKKNVGAGEKVGDKTSDADSGLTTIWHKVETAQLNSGSNTLTISASWTTDGGSYFYRSRVRRIAVVPKSWQWTPLVSETPIDVPATPAEYVYRKADTADAVTAYEYNSDFNGMFIWGGEEATVPTLTYEFNLVNSAQYDIWIYSFDGWCDVTKFKINDGEEKTIANSTSFGKSSDTGVWYAPVGTIWHKVETAQLNSGSNSLTISVNWSASENAYRSGIRCIAVVPKTWQWTPLVSETPTNVSAGSVEYVYRRADMSDSVTAYTYDSNFDGMIIWGGEQATVPELVFNFNLANSDEYDIWIDSFSEWGDVTQFKINDGEKRTITNSTRFGEIADTGVWYAPVGTVWHKVGTEQMSAGSNKLTISGVWVAFENSYRSGVRRVAVVPKSWYWTPDGTDSEPVKTENTLLNGYAYIELESVSDPGVAEKVTASDASNGGYIQAYGVDGTEPVNYNYNFKINTSGKYDIWYLGALPAGGWLSRLSVGFDSGTKTEAVVNDGDSGAALYQSWGINVQWQRISSGISITSGAHTMNLQYTHRDENMTHIIIADAIMIVPSDWGLTADDIKNKSAIETALYTDALEQVKYLENVYGDSVRYVKNLDLYKRGSAGNVILYSSLTPDILRDNGAIVYSAEGSEMGVLNIVAENGDVQSDAMQYYFTVYPNNGITISNFAINGELVANAEVTASVDIKYTDAAEKNAVIILALTDSEGRLKNVSMESAAPLAESQTLTTSLTMPSNVDGCRLKAYLWDNMNNLMPYMPFITK